MCPYVEPSKHSPFECWQSFDFLEFWAGEALTSTTMSYSGRDVGSLDILYFKVDPDHPHRSNHFDILTPSGFLCHRCKELTHAFSRVYIYTGVAFSCKLKYIYGLKYMRVVMKWFQLRLALAAILNAKNGQFAALMAIVCSSWCTINMGTSGRHVTHAGGNDREYVIQANCMASRCTVFARKTCFDLKGYVCVCCPLPSQYSTDFPKFPRFQRPEDVPARHGSGGDGGHVGGGAAK